MKTKIFQKNLSKLIERFPKFHPMIFSFEEKNQKEILSHHKKTQNPKIILKRETKVVFAYGLNLAFFLSLKKQKFFQEIFPLLVVLEHDKKRLFHFLSQKKAENFLEDERFVIRWIEPEHLDQTLENLAIEYPLKNFEFYLSFGCQSFLPFDDLEKKLSLAIALEEGYFFERAHPKPLFSHIVHNVKKLSSSFQVGEKLSQKFSKIPALICGAGPSLEKEQFFLKQIQDRALIFAGGSAISLLSNFGVPFHFSVAVDPNEEEKTRLKESQAFSSLFLYSLRLHSQILPLFNPPYGYIKSALGGFLEFFLHRAESFKGKWLAENLSSKALSVTTLMLSLAHDFGCDPIILVGVDLCFLKEERYAKGLGFGKKNQNDLKNFRLVEAPMTFVNQENNVSKTNLGFMLESQAILEFAQKHPETTFLSSSVDGLGFSMDKIITLKPLEKIFQEIKNIPFDLNGYLHWILSQENQETCPKNCQKTFLKSLKEGLESCRKILSIIQAPDVSEGKITYVETLLEEEKIFPYLFFDYQKVCEILALKENQPFLRTRHGKLQKLSRWVNDFLLIVKDH